MIQKAKKLLRSRSGDVSTDFIFDVGTKVFLLFVLFAMMIYVMQYYNASYVCRRVVRSIETTGEYNESDIQSLVKRLSSGGLEDIDIHVTASFLPKTQHIQLRDDFQVDFRAKYPIKIAMIGSSAPLEFRMPIQISMAGMSEVFWK